MILCVRDYSNARIAYSNFQTESIMITIFYFALRGFKSCVCCLCLANVCALVDTRVN